jgi:cytochrome c biogenesis protein
VVAPPLPLDVTDRIWRFFISMRTGLLLILALGVLSLIGTLLAQAPAGMAADPGAYTSWLEFIHSKYGGWTPVFDKLGFFAVFTSIWFKAIIGAPDHQRCW